MNGQIVYALGELHKDELYVIYRQYLRLSKDEIRKRLDNRLRVNSQKVRDIVRKNGIARILAERGEVKEKGKKLEMVFDKERFVREYGLGFFKGDILDLDENRDLSYMAEIRKLGKEEEKIRERLKKRLIEDCTKNRLPSQITLRLSELAKNREDDLFFWFVQDWINQQSEMREHRKKTEQFQIANEPKEQSKRERLWVKEICRKYVNPSLILCGRNHLKFDPEFAPIRYSETGKLPIMLVSRGYKVKILFLEKWPKEIKDYLMRNKFSFLRE
jgi:hypothetical protein